MDRASLTQTREAFMNGKTLVRHGGVGAFLASVMVILSGCLTSESEQYTITLNADGKSGTMTTVMRNVQSDDRDSLGQRGDFKELMRKWKEDSYLLENVQKQVYIKERSLKLERRALVWRETALFVDVKELFGDHIRNDTLRITFREKERVTAENAAVTHRGDTTFVAWPLNVRRLVVTIRRADFHPTSNFVALFKAEPQK
jgi:hypothetical protein